MTTTPGRAAKPENASDAGFGNTGGMASLTRPQTACRQRASGANQTSGHLASLPTSACHSHSDSDTHGLLETMRTQRSLDTTGDGIRRTQMLGGAGWGSRCPIALPSISASKSARAGCERAGRCARRKLARVDPAADRLLVQLEGLRDLFDLCGYPHRSTCADTATMPTSSRCPG